ncbi:MAG: head-tail connector protein [Vallitaleaceae bacterium]|nr:head-tail connector protein [Vallitaleaceae bacterium]
MSVITVPEVKNYLRLDDYMDDDALLDLMIQNAEIYINSIVTIDETNIPMVAQAKLLLLILITDMYEHRQLLADNANEKVRYIVNSTLLQLQYSYGGDI